MNERDRETLKLVATMMANIAAIAVGVGLFEDNPAAVPVASALIVAAVYTIRGLN